MSVCYDLEIRFVLDLNKFSPNTWNWYVGVRLVVLYCMLDFTPSRLDHIDETTSCQRRCIVSTMERPNNSDVHQAEKRQSTH